MGFPTDPVTVVGIYIGLALTLMYYSYPLWKETIAYRFAEHTTIACSFSIAIVQAVRLIRNNAVTPLIQGTYHLIVPIVLGIALYTQFFKSTRWISRYVMSFLIGIGTGIAAVGVIKAQIVTQILSSITPPLTSTPLDWFNYVFVGIGFFCAISYFILTREHTGVLSIPTRIGRYVLMLGLGAYFGNTVMFRETMLAGRIEYILRCLQIIPW